MRPVTHRDPITGVVERTKVSRVGSRTCRCGKQAYTSRKLAKAVAVRQTKESGDQIEAYHCWVGHCYHLGHVPGTPRSGRRGKVADRPREQARVVPEHTEARVAAAAE